MDNIVGIVLAIVGTGVGSAIINGLWNKRKLGADATKIITDAAASVVKTIHEQNAEYRADVERLKRQAAADRKVQQMHVAWDHLAVAELRARGVILPDPPPLYAPEVA